MRRSAAVEDAPNANSAGGQKPFRGAFDGTSFARIHAMVVEGSARSRLQPVDVTLRHARRYQWIRRSVLTLSVGLTLLMPFWHLASMHGGLPPPVVGGAGAIRVLGVELLDPLALASVMLAHGASRALLWAALPGLVLVLVLGRFFCGWVCPYLPVLAASNATRWLLSRLGFRPLDLRLPRATGFVSAAVVLFASAWLGVQVLPLVYPPSIIGRETFSALYFGGLGSGAALVLAAFVFDTFVSRAGFCRTVCPGGAAFTALAQLSPIAIKRDVPKCTDCTVCDVVCNLGQRPMTSRFDAGCERCGRCVSSCPTQALSFGVGRPPVMRSKGERP
jgi:ferredoxin-type protein NapH